MKPILEKKGTYIFVDFQIFADVNIDSNVISMFTQYLVDISRQVM